MIVGAILGFILFFSIAVLLIYYGARAKHFLQAWVEVAVVFFFSNLPFLILLFLALLGRQKSEQDSEGMMDFVFGVLERNLDSGEILIYVSAIMAPVFYVKIAYIRSKDKAFNFIYTILTLVIIVGAALLFNEFKAGNLSNNSFQQSSAAVIYFCSLSLWAGSLVYSRALPDFGKPTSYSNSGKGILARLKLEGETNG